MQVMQNVQKQLMECNNKKDLKAQLINFTIYENPQVNICFELLNNNKNIKKRSEEANFDGFYHSQPIPK